MGSRRNSLGEAVLTCTHNLCLKNMKNIRIFLSENVQFLEAKFSIYLDRRTFVMKNTKYKLIYKTSFL